MDKLKGLPHLYYFNLDRRTDRRDYMESQFDRWEIKNFTRISGNRFLASEVEEWEHLVIDDNIIFQAPAVATSINHILFFKEWLEKTNDPYLLIMEDDYDLNLIEYWNFDYYYMMNRIPKNWDCVQLGYENRKLINFFLHPILIGSGFGPCVLTRHYVEKLVKIHYIDGKFFLLTNKSHMAVREIWGLLDNFVTKDGVTYCLPLITNNPDLDSDHGGDEKMSVRPWHFECRDLYYWWWTEMHHKFTLDDFFTYHKVNDWKMTKNLEFLNKKGLFYYT